jgi:hypothetical protein
MNMVSITHKTVDAVKSFVNKEYFVSEIKLGELMKFVFILTL